MIILTSKKKALEYLEKLGKNYDFNAIDSSGHSNLNNILFDIFDYNMLGSNKKDVEAGFKFLDFELIKQHIMDTDSTSNILIRMISNRSSSVTLNYILDNLNLTDESFVNSKGFQFVLNNNDWKRSNYPDQYCDDFMLVFYEKITQNKTFKKQADNIILNYFIPQLYSNSNFNSSFTDAFYNILKTGVYSFSDINEKNIDLILNQKPKKETDFLKLYNNLSVNLSESEKNIFAQSISEIEQKKKLQDLYKIKNDFRNEMVKFSNEKINDKIISYYEKINSFIKDNNISINEEDLSYLNISKNITHNERNDFMHFHKKSSFLKYESLISANEETRESFILTDVASIFTDITGIDLTEQLKAHYSIDNPRNIAKKEALKLVEEEQLKLGSLIKKKPSIKP